MPLIEMKNREAECTHGECALMAVTLELAPRGEGREAVLEIRLRCGGHAPSTDPSTLQFALDSSITVGVCLSDSEELARLAEEPWFALFHAFVRDRDESYFELIARIMDAYYLEPQSVAEGRYILLA